MFHVQEIWLGVERGQTIFFNSKYLYQTTEKNYFWCPVDMHTYNKMEKGWFRECGQNGF